jgi:hypothetical protein
MDRIDFQDVIVQLAGVTRKLLKMCDAYEQERKELLARLSRTQINPREFHDGASADLHPDGIKPGHTARHGSSRA